MSQKGGNNWLWWTIGSISVIGVGAGAYLYFRKKKKDAELAAAINQPEPKKSIVQTIVQGAKEVVQGAAVPFTTDAQGNEFRGWVNDKYPDYAKSISLDRTGKKDNSFVKKAFAKYGVEYLKDTPASSSVSSSISNWSNIKNQMTGSAWKGNSRVTDDSLEKLQIGINVDGNADVYANFTPSGGFWLEKMGGDAKYSGTWVFNNGQFTLTLGDGGFSGSDASIAKLVKNAMKAKYPSEMKYYSFDNFGADGLDTMLNRKLSKHVDSQDAML